jgi:hypothetical protein
MDENILFFKIVFYFNIFKKSGHVRYLSNGDDFSSNLVCWIGGEVEWWI